MSRPFQPPTTASYLGSLLRAAGTLAGPFTKADLAVAAWQADPTRFGLAGYADRYPDANRVFCKLYGASGLVARGLVVALPDGRYEVTPLGRRALATPPAATAPVAPPAPKATAPAPPRPSTLPPMPTRQPPLMGIRDPFAAVLPRPSAVRS